MVCHIWMAAGKCCWQAVDFSGWTYYAVYRYNWRIIYPGSAFFWSRAATWDATIPFWSQKAKRNLAGADFSRLRFKKRTAGIIPCKMPICWKWVWQLVLPGYLWFQMAGIPFWNWTIKRTDAQHSAGVGFDYSCFLNRLPNIQFLCSEHNKEKNISIFFLYASLHSQLYSFISKVHHLLV